jgi:hypothetical protein
MEPNPREQGGLTPLDIAVEADNGSVAELLIEKGAIAPKYMTNFLQR